MGLCGGATTGVIQGDTRHVDYSSKDILSPKPEKIISPRS